MKAILRFDLPEEQQEFDRAINATKLFAAVQEFDTFLKNILKYGDLTEIEQKAFSAIREQLYSKLEDSEIILWE